MEGKGYGWDYKNCCAASQTVSRQGGFQKAPVSFSQRRKVFGIEGKALNASAAVGLPARRGVGRAVRSFRRGLTADASVLASRRFAAQTPGQRTVRNTTSQTVSHKIPPVRRNPIANTLRLPWYPVGNDVFSYQALADYPGRGSVAPSQGCGDGVPITIQTQEAADYSIKTWRSAAQTPGLQGCGDGVPIAIQTQEAADYSIKTWRSAAQTPGLQGCGDGVPITIQTQEAADYSIKTWRSAAQTPGLQGCGDGVPITIQTQEAADYSIKAWRSAAQTPGLQGCGDGVPRLSPHSAPAGLGASSGQAAGRGRVAPVIAAGILFTALHFHGMSFVVFFLHVVSRMIPAFHMVHGF